MIAPDRRIQNSKFKIQNLRIGEHLGQKWQKLAKALSLLGFSLLSIFRFGRVDSFLVGWALPTTAIDAVVKSSINSLLNPCSFNILKTLDIQPTGFDRTRLITIRRIYSREYLGI